MSRSVRWRASSAEGRNCRRRDGRRDVVPTISRPHFPSTLPARMPPTQPKSAWARVIEAIDRPLGFFVLALLIVETFLATVAGIFRFTTPYDFYALVIGVCMFVYITLTVTFLVWFKPENLTFDKDAHLKRRRNAPFGTEQKQVKDIDKLLPTEAEIPSTGERK